MSKAGRDTTTGKSYELTVEQAINRSCSKNRLIANPQVNIGKSPSGRRHVIDWELVSLDDSSVRGLVSVKYQATGGTAEEKVAYEVVKLIHAMREDSRYKRSWLVLGGVGWTPGLKLFYRDELHEFIPDVSGKVVIITDTDTLLSTDLALD